MVTHRNYLFELLYLGTTFLRNYFTLDLLIFARLMNSLCKSTWV